MTNRARDAHARRARLTRERVVAAASELFVRDGYLQTTMTTIAAGAGVAVQTLYLGFDGKAAILQAAHDRAVDGGAEPMPVLDRPWRARMRAEPDGRGALAVFIREGARIITRVYPLYEAMRTAAGDADVAAVLATNEDRRYRTYLEVVRDLSSKPGFVASDLARCTQSLFTVFSHESYGMLVVSHGWSVAAWRAWALRISAEEMFGPADPR